MLASRLCALPRCTTRSLRLALPTRPFSSSPARFNATPDWEELIGGRAGIERKRAAFTDKYRDALEAKARAEGITVDQLRERSAAQAKAARAVAGGDNTVQQAPLGPVEAGSMDTRKTERELQEPEVVRPAPSAPPAKKQPLERKSSDSPIKVRPLSPSLSYGCTDADSPYLQPLNDIMDLTKAVDLTTTALSQLWTTYHQTKGFLSAAVPLETYLRMLNSARKFPLFVLPLAKVAELPEGQAEATEMHLLVRASSPSLFRLAPHMRISADALPPPRAGMVHPPATADDDRARPSPLDRPIHPSRRVQGAARVRPAVPDPDALHGPRGVAQRRPHARRDQLERDAQRDRGAGARRPDAALLQRLGQGRVAREPAEGALEELPRAAGAV